MNKKRLTILIHVAGCIALFLLPIILLNFPHQNLPNPYPERPKWILSFLPFLIITYFILILFFYFNLYYLLPQLYYKSKKWLYVLIVLVVMIFVVVVVPYIKHSNLQADDLQPLPLVEAEMPAIKGNLYLKDSIGNFVATSLPYPLTQLPQRDFWRMTRMDHMLGFFNFLIIWLLSTAAFLALRSRNMEQRNKEMKVEKLNAELSYLKAQINPHFLFNTLNNIYSLSIWEKEQTPEAILKLSAIMRYTTQEAKEDLVPLPREIEYITNYISLQQLRSNDHLKVTFNVTGDTGRYQIAPLLLINFIENAFKYGVSNHLPCFVNIDILVKNNHLTMSVINKKMIANEKQEPPTGINNTKRRLQLQYHDNHQLTIKDLKELYEINLIINLV